jgi:hypothetical protein
MLAGHPIMDPSDMAISLCITVIDPFKKPPSACANDCFLMEQCFAHGHRSKALKQLNSCRQHHLHHALQHGLSDVCSPNCRHLLDAATKVQLDLSQSSCCSWPCAHRPKFGRHSLWRSALLAIFLFAPLLVLKDAVQPLLLSVSSANSSWLLRHSPLDQRLFIPAGPTWDFCHHVQAACCRSLNRLHQLSSSVLELPVDGMAATASLQGSQACLLSLRFPSPGSMHQRILLTFSQTLDASPLDSKWAIQECNAGLSPRLLEPCSSCLIFAPKHCSSDK